MSRFLDEKNRFQADVVRNLQDAFDKFTRPSWLGLRPRPRDIAEFCEVIAQAKQRLAEGVYRQFPEINRKDFTITGYTIKDPEPTGPTEAA